jgi:methionyl-tRNA formyltransferase
MPCPSGPAQARTEKPFATSRPGAPRRLRTIFFGSSDFAVPSLRALASAHDIAAVYTQADRPAGRGLKLTPTPVKAAAVPLGLDVFTPEKLDAGFVALAAGLRPELLACVSYGKILPAALLESATLGALNVHPSLLPQYRGATPIQAALREGRETTGVSIIWMSPQMDAGDIALQRSVAIEATDDFAALHDRLAKLGSDMLLEAAAQLGEGRLARTPQDHARATFTKPLRKEDLRIDFNSDPLAVVNQVRSLSPKPGAWALVNGVRVKVLEAEVSPRGNVGVDGDAFAVACRGGVVRLLKVTPEGKPAMTGAEFARQLK